MTRKNIGLIVATMLMAALPLAGCHASAEASAGTTPAKPPPPPPPPAVTPPPPPAATAATPPPAAITPPTGGSVSGSKITIPGNIVYETGKSTLKPESEPTLTLAKQFLDNNPQVTQLRIEGHTDSDGDDAMNLKLSGERALACVNWLVAKGIVRDRLLAVGFGETKPIKPNDTPDDKAQNRRTEFHIATLNGKNLLGKDPTAGGTVYK